MNNIKISTVITAGGTSQRYGKNKLLEKLGNSTVIETTIKKFLDLSDEIVIPANKETENFLLNSSIFCDKIKFAPAGETRQKSVYNALFTCQFNGIVLIHDGARPFIEIETIKKIIEKTIEDRAVIAGFMATNTIKEVKDGKIIKTIDRKKIFEAQTPQAFDMNLIKKVHEEYKNRIDFTDDSSMIEEYGITPSILLTSRNNKKITTKEDLL